MAQGNALWGATIEDADLGGSEPFWKRKRFNHLPLTSAWCFLPLAELAELAKERVAIDVVIAGMLKQRMTTIPVILEHGLAGDSGGSTGGASSDGTSYQYSAGIEKIGKDFVTMSVHLEVRQRGEAEMKFEETLQVFKDRTTDIRPEPRIRIRAYFEGAEP